MSSNKQNEYDEDFRKSCAKLAVDSDQPICRTAKELGIKAPTLYVWVKKYHSSKPSINKAGKDNLLEENKRLKKELQRVTEEREIGSANIYGEIRHL